MKRLMMCVTLAVAASANLPAALLDLAGTDMTVADVADLASYDGVTNSSATAATLTFNIAADQSYANTIGGNGRLTVPSDLSIILLEHQSLENNC